MSWKMFLSKTKIILILFFSIKRFSIRFAAKAKPPLLINKKNTLPVYLGNFEQLMFFIFKKIESENSGLHSLDFFFGKKIFKKTKF